MAYTAPRTWTVGEVVTAAIMNAHVRDNLLAIASLAGTSRTNPAAVGSWRIPSASSSLCTNTQLDFYYNTAGENAYVNWDAIAALGGTIQMRHSVVFNISVIVPGAPTVITWTSNIRKTADRGTAAGGGVIGLGSAVNLGSNAVGYKAADSGWQTSPWSGGANAIIPAFRSDRTGGSGPGSLTDLTEFIEVKNV
jgi:hypothetical protein